MFYSLFICFTVVTSAECFCGENVRWSHSLSPEDAYGMWYGVGYAQHTPDMTNRPVDIGCITLYISDAGADLRDDWLDWSLKRRHYNDSDWRSSKSNPRSRDALSGSRLGAQLRRRRAMYQERRVRVLWDEDGHTMEQTYVYSPEEPGLWTAEQWRPGERELRSRGVDLWYPDDPPRHPEVIRILKLVPDELILNHCTELGDGGIFSLVLRRVPARARRRREQLDWQQLLLSFGLTNPYRYKAVCAACVPLSSLLCLLVGLVVVRSL